MGKKTTVCVRSLFLSYFYREIVSLLLLLPRYIGFTMMFSFFSVNIFLAHLTLTKSLIQRLWRYLVSGTLNS